MPTPENSAQAKFAELASGRWRSSLHYSTLYCAFEPQDEQLELIVVVWGAWRCGGRLRTCRPDRLACNRSVLFVECSQLGLLSLAFAILYPAAWGENLPQ